MTPEEIKNLAKAVFEEGAKGIEKKVAEKGAANAEQLKAANDKIAQLTEKVSKLESAPVGGVCVTKHNFGTFHDVNVNEVVEHVRSKGMFCDKSIAEEENRENAALFAKWAIALHKSLTSHDMTAYREFCKAANVEGTDANGGYLVPSVLMPEIIKAIRNDSFALRECTVLTMSAPEIKFPAENALVSAAFVDENSAATASNPTFSQVSIKAKKAVALTDGVSSELLQDSVVAFVGILVDQMNYALSQLIDDTVLNGISGNTTDFQGLLVGATAIQNVQLAQTKVMTDIGYDNIADLVGKLAPSDAVRAKFCLSNYELTILRKVKASGSGLPLFADAVKGDAPTILGKPYFISEKMPGSSDASTAAKNVLVFGDWKQYYLGIMPGSLAIEADPYTNFNKDTVRFRMKLRVGGNPVRKSAFAVLKTGAAAS
ncbi:phage major capsid protein [Candidatus Saccharibacteria bacterium]|nr:phage major capsid protein [Candidatus Saccharibacteria bacterium]